MDQTSQQNEDRIFENIAVEVMRALRGTETQMFVSAALGFSFNQVAKWESQEKNILVSDFFKLAAHKNIFPKQILKNIFFNYSDDFHQVSSLLKELQGTMSINDFAVRIGENRLKVARWLSAEVEISLSNFLKILYKIRNCADLLVSEVVPIEQVPSLMPYLNRALAIADRVGAKPWVSLFMQMLTHPSCPEADKVPQYFSDLSKIPFVEVENTINEMKQVGILVPNSKGFYERPHRRLVFSKEKMDESKLYWVKAAALAYENLKNEDDQFRIDNPIGFAVLSASDESWKKIRDHYRLFFEGLTRIIDADEGKQTKVKIASLQIFDAETLWSQGTLGTIEIG